MVIESVEIEKVIFLPSTGKVKFSNDKFVNSPLLLASKLITISEVKVSLIKLPGIEIVYLFPPFSKSLLWETREPPIVPTIGKMVKISICWIFSRISFKLLFCSSVKNRVIAFNVFVINLPLTL